MKSLVMILHNLKTNTFHPVWYYEKPFPGSFEEDKERKIIRFQSKGHHTTGFADRNEAVKHINEDLVVKIKEHTIYTDVTIEIENGDLPWDGEGIPADNQIRNK